MRLGDAHPGRIGADAEYCLRSARAAARAGSRADGWTQRREPFLRLRGLDAAYAYLRERNVVANAPAIADYGMKQLYLKDPDGYEICFQHPVREPGE